jgi:hypothetical protein
MFQKKMNVPASRSAKTLRLEIWKQKKATCQSAVDKGVSKIHEDNITLILILL